MQMIHEASGKLNSILDQWQNDSNRQDPIRTVNAIAKKIAYQSMKFYFPLCDILANRDYADFRDALKLPFPSVILATEKNTKKGHADVLIFASQNPGLHDFKLSNGEIFFTFAMRDIGTRIWYTLGALWGLQVNPIPPDDTAFRRIYPQTFPDKLLTILKKDHADVSEMTMEMGAWASKVMMNFLVMLSLGNVAIENHDVDVLNRKRRKSMLRPLYSFHTLIVDGEKWRAKDLEESGSGVRSHLRRGHIRRLHNSLKRVWVRATLVQGSRPGFVEKEYDVSLTQTS